MKKKIYNFIKSKSLGDKLRLNFLLILFLLLFPSIAYSQQEFNLKKGFGYVGDKVEFQIVKFTPNSSLSIFWKFTNGSLVSLITGKTDSKGEFKGNITIPADKGGRKLLLAMDEKGLKANSTFLLLPKIVELDKKDIKPGDKVMARGSGGVESMLIFLDNVKYEVKPEIKRDGSFSFEFLALSAGLHGITLVNFTGILFHSFLYNVSGVTNENLMEVELANYLGLRSLSKQVSDFFKSLSSLSIRLDENTALLREDIKFLLDKSLRGSEISQKIILNNFSSIREDILTSLKEIDSKVGENLRLGSNMERDLANLKDRLDTFEDNLSSIERNLLSLRQDLSSSLSSIQNLVSGLKEPLNDVISRIDELSSNLKLNFDNLMEVNRESLRNITLLVLTYIPQLMESLTLIQIFIIITIILLVIFSFIRRKKLG